MDIINFNGYKSPSQRVIAISSQKGGVGKTTTAINIAAFLCELGFNIILIDLDEQCNCTSGVGIDYTNVNPSIYDILISNKNPNKIILNTPYKNLKIIPSSWKLSNIESELAFLNGKEFRLRDAIEKIEYNFDFIIIDCPASLGILTINAFAASKEILIPVQCEFYAIEGISRLIETINLVKSKFNNTLEILGIVLTMYTRTRLSNQVIKKINEYFTGKIFKTTIPKNVCLAEAPSLGKPIIAYNPLCKGALAYKDLTKEIIEGNTIADREHSVFLDRLKDFWDTGDPPRHAVKRYKEGFSVSRSEL